MEIRVQNLWKSYNGVTVLRDVTFTAGSGVTCVMAPSGRGKTTLLRILLGLETADSGTVTGLEGRRWAAVFQEDRLLEHLDVDPLHFTSNHASNYLPLKGGLPEDRKRFLDMIDQALAGKIRLRKTLKFGAKRDPCLIPQTVHFAQNFILPSAVCNYAVCIDAFCPFHCFYTEADNCPAAYSIILLWNVYPFQTASDTS